MDVFGIALSGMNAASAMLGTAAANIANVDTPGYQPRRVNLATGPDGTGVVVDSVTFDSTAASPVDAGGHQSSGVDLATELVNVDRAKFLYDANAMVVRTADQMLGGLLDVLDHNPDRNNGSADDRSPVAL
jgi:flagellar hook-associated protein FlgK